jgi:hypothetical protein
VTKKKGETARTEFESVPGVPLIKQRISGAMVPGSWRVSSSAGGTRRRNAAIRKVTKKPEAQEYVPIRHTK